ncbi:MAG TPA: hypothetical protein VFF06_14470 [Polyangia bacterium]|nr:hypothetical protein [Polyangia bacterium]
MSIVDDYAERVKRLSRNARRIGKEFHEARKGGWEATATAYAIEGHREKSLWLMEELDDGGIWDLCELLTFVSGRRVTTNDLLDRFNPGPYSEPCCSDMEVLPTAAAAWEKRSALVERDVVYALAYYNEALSIRLLPALGALYCSALNILADSLVDSYSASVSKTARRLAIDAVKAVLTSLQGVTEEERGALIGTAINAITQGPSPMNARLTQLLIDHGVVPSESNTVVKDRIRYVMAARNWHAHGRLRSIAGLSIEQANRFAQVATTSVVPSIIRLVIGRLLGFTENGHGARSQLAAAALRKFFATGKWHDWDISVESFQAYFDRLGEQD